MVRTQIQLTEEQARLLKKLAAEQGVSVAELIREGVSEMLKDSHRMDPAERVKRALEIAGRFHSRKTDISSKHDRYLHHAYEK